MNVMMIAIVFIGMLMPMLMTTNALYVSKSGYDLTRWPRERVEAEAETMNLHETNRRVLFDKATELSYSGRFISGERYNLKERGIYVCAIGGLPLFRSEHKFVSGTGWPSFYDVFDSEHIEEIISPTTKGYTEILCRRTGCHIGHCFPDRPPPKLAEQFRLNGQMKYLEKYGFVRYCVNASALRFVAIDSA
jgi:peptide-methionine (R)-S-oxide reductase